MIDLKPSLEISHNRLLVWFLKTFPNLVKEMDNTTHFFDDENINPYHVENRILTHTLLVFKNSQAFSLDNHIVKWSALLHDIGKPKAKEDVPERKRSRFIAHEGVSAFMSIDILNKTDLSVDDKLMIFRLIALHGTLFHFIKADGTIKKDILDTFKGEAALLENLTHQVRADSFGRFIDEDRAGDNDPLFTQMLPTHFKPFYSQLNNDKPKSDESLPQLTILVGPPCSYKSTKRDELIKNNPDTVIISRDDLVVAAGEKRDLNYGDAFRFLMDNKDVEKVEVTDKLNEKYMTARKEKKDVIIDFTSMSKKSRRKWINEFKGYNIKCKLFLSGYDALVECNKKRGEETGKHIPEGVILNMCKSFSLPMYSEGFTDIEYIWND